MKAFIRKNRALVAFVIISLIVSVAGIVTAPGNELIFMLLAQYITLPVAGFICSACAAKKGKFLHPVAFILIAVLLPLPVLKTTDVAFLIFAAVPCLIGLVLGLVLGLIGYLISKNKKVSRDEKKELKEEKLRELEDARNEAEDFSVGADDANSSEANAPEAEEVEEAEEATVEAEE